MTNSLDVYHGLDLVGRLWLDDKRNFVFQYDPSWTSSAQAIPLSIALPLQAEPFTDDAPRFFFSNILPEGRIKALIAKEHGVSEKNDFKLLEEIGGECAGAISVLTSGKTPDPTGTYEEISKAELDRMIAEMPRRPLLTSKEGLRLSLAGAQNKLPVFVKDTKLFLPRGAYSSSHILKPPIPDFPDSVENEAFCMMLARECGLPVPEVTILKGARQSILISRYDRKVVEGKLVRTHQEDFCQALGYSYEQKYQSEGGPGLKECLALLQDNSANPIIDKEHLLRWVVFNWLIGNCDAHAKNISLLIRKETGVRLAPFYDLMSTRIYPTLSDKLAMKVGGENRTEWVSRRHWERLAGEADVSPKAILGICEQAGTAVPASAKKLSAGFIADYGASETINKIVEHLDKLGSLMLRNIRLGL